jgi:hypothetical protein
MHSGVNNTSKFIIKKKHNNNNKQQHDGYNPFGWGKKAPDYLIQISYLQSIQKLYN